MEKCPCGTHVPYSACCKFVHDDHRNAQSAEVLMRARFTAFSKGLIDFLYYTTHPTTRIFCKKTEIHSWVKDNKWMNLEILQSTKNTVEFKAYYLNKWLETDVQHEISEFKRLNSKWYYLRGVVK